MWWPHLVLAEYLVHKTSRVEKHAVDAAPIVVHFMMLHDTQK